MFFQSGSSLGLAVRLPFGVKGEVKQPSGWLVGRFLSALVRFLSQSLVSASVTMSGQEYKDGQFYKTPRRQEPSIYAISSTWRHSWNIRINRHHHALKLTPGEMLDDHDCAHNQPTHFVVQPHRRLVHPPPGHRFTKAPPPRSSSTKTAARSENSLVPRAGVSILEPLAIE
jgi:hypothetical protein